MLRLFSLLAVTVVLALGGCVSASEERISLLESAVVGMQTQEMRLASLEGVVASLMAARSENDEQAPIADGPQTALPAVVKTVPSEKRGKPTPPPASHPPAKVAVPPKKVDAAQAGREYQAALSTFEAGNYQTAQTRFRNFLDHFPAHSLSPNAGYWLGECHYSMKQYEAAVAAFKDVVAQFPQHPKAAAAMLKVGYSYALLGDKDNARFFLEALLRDFPSSQPASLARGRLASL